MLLELRREAASTNSLALNALRAELDLTRADLAKSTSALADRDELIEMLSAEISWLDQNIDELAQDLESACAKENQLVENLAQASAEVKQANGLQSFAQPA
jgi:chromosome segregation ATPase